MTTIQVSDETLRLLKIKKASDGNKSYDELIRELIKEGK